MAVVAAAELVLDVARGTLYVDAGAPTAALPTPPRMAAHDDQSIVLACAGDVMYATVGIESHDQAPAPLADPWITALEKVVMNLPSGDLLLENLDGGEVRYPDLGITAGRWNVDVHVAGREKALALQDQMDAEFERGNLDLLPGLGPERWLVRFWR
ncbi:hypothetical protein ATJ97_3608 [Georgenia soli]|uniref:Uncharacterized protein n=1 Tax=Georgenia soli TaxID=638953 RepID=A0A2A9ES16_9MICO|nr:hypothetical protein [Georgenia soli]PFG41062.1 hypothetical protein ATJ97_3608 [Georgenia soli]